MKKVLIVLSLCIMFSCESSIVNNEANAQKDVESVTRQKSSDNVVYLSGASSAYVGSTKSYHVGRVTNNELAIGYASWYLTLPNGRSKYLGRQAGTRYKSIRFENGEGTYKVRVAVDIIDIYGQIITHHLDKSVIVYKSSGR